MGQSDLRGLPADAMSSGLKHGYTNVQKIALFAPCVRQRYWPRRNLVAGPYVGEFGYELMQWQGYIRARRPFYENVHVLTYPGRDYLYEGMNVHHHSVDLRTAGYGYGWMPLNERKRLANDLARRLGLQNYDIFDTSHLCTRYHKMLFWKQDLRLFRETPKPGGMRDVAFHFRAIDKDGPDRSRNYNPELVQEVVELAKQKNWRVLCIGHPKYSLCPQGVEDFRSEDLKETVSAICSVRLIAGELSGPLHLANLCGVPAAFFAEGQWRIDHCLGWNPFRVPLYVIAKDTMRPPAHLVIQGIENALADLHSRTEGFKKPPYVTPAQPFSLV
jgi:hypothetical protein